MSAVVSTIISLFVIAISFFLLYQYLVLRDKDEKKIKDWVKLKLDKKILSLMLTALIISALIYAYSFYLMKGTFIRSLMNAEVIMWLIVLAYIDIKDKIVPNKLIVSGIAFWAILAILEIVIEKTSWQQVLFFSLIGGGVCGGILLVIALIVKSALGMGDVKMFFVIGLLYGLTNTYSILLFSILVMAVVSIVLLITKKVNRKTAIPMAPFVAIGLFLNILMGM